MVEKVAAKKPKTYKIPKSLGACADRLHELKQERLKAQAVADAIEAEEKAVKEHIINTLPKGDTGASGKFYNVRTYNEDIPQVEDWTALYAYIAKNKAWDLLQRRLNPAAVNERLEAKKKVPGTKMFTAVKISLTKIKGR